MNYNLIKRGKCWHYYFRVNRKRYRGSTKTQTKELANDYVKKLYEQIYRHQNKITSPKTRIDEFIDYHLKTIGENTSKDWYYIKSYLLKSFLGYTKELDLNYLEEVQLSHLERYQNKLLQNSKPKTAKNNLTAITTLFNHAVKLGYIYESPIKNLTQYDKYRKNKKRFLTKEEIELVLDTVKNSFLYNFVLCGIYTSMRRSELINLKCDDMDIKRKPIYVRNKDEFQTKSRKERVLPMHQKLFKTFSKPENGYCFMNNNKKLGKESTTRLFTEITKSIKLKDVSLHTLRHTFISHCLMNNISPWKVGKWVSHSSVYITELYGHLCPDRRKIDRLKF